MAKYSLYVNLYGINTTYMITIIVKSIKYHNT